MDLITRDEPGRSQPTPTDRLVVLHSEEAELSADNLIAIPGPATIFGVVLKGTAIIGERPVGTGEFFSRPVEAGEHLIVRSFAGRTALFVRQGWTGGHHIVAGKVRAEGDVAYIDGCRDTLLVAPPRLGDACLNALYLPQGVEQTFHTHPSVRIGVVLKGKGFASLAQDGSQEIALAPGDAWVIGAGELHRFRTPEDELVVVAYHPDSDWGPTDEDHPMLNRTILPSS